jgi:hypothetical protein
MNDRVQYSQIVSRSREGEEEEMRTRGDICSDSTAGCLYQLKYTAKWRKKKEEEGKCDLGRRRRGLRRRRSSKLGRQRFHCTRSFDLLLHFVDYARGTSSGTSQNCD